MDPFYVDPESRVVPDFDDPIGRILFFAQIGRGEEAARVAEYWMRNAGWNNYEHALRQAQQRELGGDDPYLQVRQDFENDFDQLEDDFVRTLWMVRNGTIQRAKLEAWQQWFTENAQANAVNLNVFRRLNEARGTWETRNYRHMAALRDLTLRQGEVGTDFPTIGVDENAPPVFLPPAPVPPRRHDVGMARWLHQL